MERTSEEFYGRIAVVTGGTQGVGEPAARRLASRGLFGLVISGRHVFDGYDAIVTACCAAWNRFADDPAIVTSITSRKWAEVIP